MKAREGPWVAGTEKGAIPRAKAVEHEEGGRRGNTPHRASSLSSDELLGG